MAETYRAEIREVGPALKAHREALGVTMSELVAVRGAGSDAYFRFTERAERPSLARIEVHHGALIAAWVAGGRKPLMARSTREQWYSTPADLTLWHQAVKKAPGCRWWWGLSNGRGRYGAWCYVCNKLIIGYDIKRPMTDAKRSVLMDHRFQHMMAETAGALGRKKGSSV